MKGKKTREGRRERKDEEREGEGERERGEIEGREEDFPPLASSRDGSNFRREERGEGRCCGR